MRASGNQVDGLRVDRGAILGIGIYGNDDGGGTPLVLEGVAITGNVLTNFEGAADATAIRQHGNDGAVRLVSVTGNVIDDTVETPSGTHGTVTNVVSAGNNPSL